MAAALKLEDLVISPHSLRRGSATSMFKLCGSFDKVADAGRWENIRTCRKYVDKAVAEMFYSKLESSDLLRAAEKMLLDCFV